jgi:hypothetical protein
VELGGATHTQPAGFDIQFEGGRAYHLAEFTGGFAPQRVHLEEPVLGRCVALQEQGVFDV